MSGHLRAYKRIVVGLLIVSTVIVFWRFDIKLSKKTEPEHVQFQPKNNTNLENSIVSNIDGQIVVNVDENKEMSESEEKEFWRWIETNKAGTLNLQDNVEQTRPEDPEILDNQVDLTLSVDNTSVQIDSEIWRQIAETHTLDLWMNSGNITYDDPLLVEYVRNTYLMPPDKSLPYNLSSKETNPSEGQIQAVWKILKNVKNGFYIDCGANDGEFISNTLWLEKEKGWNGILIEADPTTFSKLRTKHRKAWHCNLCLSPQKFPESVSFFQNPYDSGINGLDKREKMNVTMEIKVQCIPLYTILLGLKRDVVDFFSLDIEGYELEVLKTIPFDKIFIKTLAIEHWSIPEGARGLRKFMEQQNYTLYKKIDTRLSQDSIFVHNSLLPLHFKGKKIER